MSFRRILARCHFALLSILLIPGSSGAVAWAQGAPSADKPAAAATGAGGKISSASDAHADAYAKESLIVLEHASVVRFSADGLGERTETMRVKMQSDAAVRALGVLTIPYASSSERLEIVYLRVRKPDGSVVATSDQDAQDMPSAVTRTAPMYSDTREKQIPVKSLSVGDTLEYQVKITMTSAQAPGQFWYAQNFLISNVVQAETVELRVPLKKFVQVVSPSLLPEKKEEGGETVYRWKTSQLLPAPASEDEKKAYQKKLKAQSKQSSILVTTYRSWAEVGAWYRELAKDRVKVTPEVQAKADEVTRGLKTDDEKLQAIYSYVSTQIRYISVSFGVGRYQPHAAAEVLANQYGDCKDKHTLLAALLAAEGIAAEPVLIGSSLKLNPDVPTPAWFDHVITVVPRGKEKVWLDATPEVAPYRMLLQPLRDKQALLIPADGPATLEMTPAEPPFPSFYEVNATGTLDSAGTLKGHIDATLRSDSEVYLREGLHQTARAQWSDLFQNVSYAQGYAGTVSNVDAMLPEKTAEPFHYSYDYERKEFSDWANHRIMALLPGLDLAIAGDDKPDEPIELGAPAKESFRSTITLPGGFTAELPEAVTIRDKIFDYTSTYTMKGQQFVTERKLTIKVSKVPLEDWERYKKLQKQVIDDYGQFVQLYSGDQKQEANDAGNPEAQRLVQEAFEDIRARNFTKAGEDLDAAERVNPKQWGLWAQRGFIKARSGDGDGAIEDYEKEIANHPTNKPVYAALIWTESNFRHKDKVFDTTKQMAAAFPGDAEVEAQYGNALLTRGDDAQALEELQKALKDSGDNKLYAVRLGVAQLKTGKQSDGQVTLETALKDSEDSSVLNDASYELADAGLDLPLAEERCRHALTLQDAASQPFTASTAGRKEFLATSSFGNTWDTMGWIFFREGKLTEAESYVRAAWMLSQAKVVGYHLGKVYEAMGKKQEALRAYQQAMRSQAPGNSEDHGKEIRDRIAGLGAPSGATTGQAPKETEELLKMRMIDLPEFKKGTESSADFNLLWSDGKLEDVVFIKGDEALRPAVELLKRASPAQTIPQDSKAKIVRRGIMACSDITKSCQMVLMYPLDAIQAQAAPITIQ